MTFPFPTFIPAGQIPLEFVDSRAVKTASIAMPAASAVGNLAVLFDFARNASSSVPSEVVPSGWTKLAGDTDPSGSNANRSCVSYKVLGAGDIGATITGMSGSTTAKIIVVFTCPKTPAVSNWGAQNASTTPASRSLPASSIGKPLIVFGMLSAQSSSNWSFSTASPPFSAEIATATGSSPFMRVGYTIYPTTVASDHTIAVSDMGNANAIATGIIAF